MSGLDAGTRLALKRTWPSVNGVGGYLEDIELGDDPETNAADLMAYIRDTYGGGRYTVQARQRKGGARHQFGQGSAVFQIAGESKVGGLVYRQGRLQSPHAETSPQAPMVAQVMPAQNGTESVAQLLQLLQSLGFVPASAQNMAAPMSPPPLEGVASLVQALGNTVHPPVQRNDTLSELKKTLGFFRELKSLMEVDAGGPAPTGGIPGSPLGGLGLGGGIEAALVQKFLDDRPAAPPSAPPGWAFVGGRWVQTAAPPPPTPAAAPTPPAPAAATAPAPSTPAAPAAPTGPTVVPDDEPYTAAEIADSMDAMDPKARAELLRELLERAGPEAQGMLMDAVGSAFDINLSDLRENVANLRGG